MAASLPCMCLSLAWIDNREEFDDFVLRKFQSALDGEACEWPSVRVAVRGRFGAGMANIKAKAPPDPRLYLLNTQQLTIKHILHHASKKAALIHVPYVRGMVPQYFLFSRGLS